MSLIRRPKHEGQNPPRDTRDIEAVLRREQGNVTRAARALGMHRNQLRRWLTRHNIDAKMYGPGDGDE